MAAPYYGNAALAASLPRSGGNHERGVLDEDGEDGGDAGVSGMTGGGEDPAHDLFVELKSEFRTLFKKQRWSELSDWAARFGAWGAERSIPKTQVVPKLERVQANMEEELVFATEILPGEEHESEAKVNAMVDVFQNKQSAAKTLRKRIKAIKKKINSLYL